MTRPKSPRSTKPIPRFGKLLRQKREERGVTLAQLASKLGCAVSYLSDIERGRRYPLNLSDIFKSATLLCCDATEMAVAAASDRGTIALDCDQDPRMLRIIVALALHNEIPSRVLAMIETMLDVGDHK